MLQTRQIPLRLAKRLPAPVQRRFDSSHTSHDAHKTAHDAHHAPPSNESFGTGFYLMIGALPVGYFLATRTDDPNKSFLARLLPDFKGEWEKRNSLHTQAVEQAGTDRALFINAPHRQDVPVKIAENVFNGGSPYNRSASNSVNLDEVMNHYKRKNEETAAKIEKKTPEEKFAQESS